MYRSYSLHLQPNHTCQSDTAERGLSQWAIRQSGMQVRSEYHRQRQMVTYAIHRSSNAYKSGVRRFLCPRSLCFRLHHRLLHRQLLCLRLLVSVIVLPYWYHLPPCRWLPSCRGNDPSAPVYLQLRWSHLLLWFLLQSIHSWLRRNLWFLPWLRSPAPLLSSPMLRQPYKYVRFRSGIPLLLKSSLLLLR